MEIFELRSVAYGNGKFVAVGETRDFTSNAANKIYSTDGVNWNKSAGNHNTYDNYSHVAFGNGKFVTSTYSDGDIIISSDGYSWDLAYENLVIAASPKVFADGKFVIPIKGKTCMSADGSFWDRYSNNLDFYPNGVCYGNGRFVVVGDDGKVAYSADGVDWTNVTIKNGFSIDMTTLNNVCYGNGKYIVVGDDGNVRYSTDGISWSEKIVLGSYNLYVIFPAQ